MLAIAWAFVKANRQLLLIGAVVLGGLGLIGLVRHEGYKAGIAHEAVLTARWVDATHSWQAAVGRQNKALDAWKAERDRKVTTAEKAAHEALRGQKAVEGRVEKLLHARLSGKDVCERFEEADKLVLGGLR